MNPPKKYNPGKEKPPQSVSQGDIVLAKVPNWPWWPVYILSEDQVTQETRSLFGTNATTDQNYRYFQFFHTFEYDFAHMRNMRPFYPEIWRLQLDNNMIKRTDLRAAFRQALDPDDFLANQKVTIEKDFARENKEISEEDFEAYEKKMIEKLEEREAMEEQIFKKALELSIKNEPKTQDVQEYTVSSSSSLSSRRVTAQSDGSIKKETANDQHTSTRRSIRTRKESPQEQQSQLKDDNPHKQAHQLSLSSSSMNQPPPSELSRIDTHSSTEDQLTPQSQHPIVQKPQSTQPSSSIISESNQSPQKQEQSVIPLPVSNSEQGKEQDVTAEVHPLKEQSQNQRQNRDEQISENTQGQIGLDRNSGEGGVKRELEEQEDNQNHQMKKLRRSTNVDDDLTHTLEDSHHSHHYQQQKPSTQQEQELDQPPVEVTSPIDIAVVPESPEDRVLVSVVHTPPGDPERQYPETAMRNDREEDRVTSSIMQSGKTQINNDMVQPSDPITTTHENSTDTKQVIKPETSYSSLSTSTSPSITTVPTTTEEQGKGSNILITSGTTNTISEDQLNTQPKFKRAILIKYRLQKILDKYQHTDEWPLHDNRLMKVAITDIQKSNIPQSTVEILHLKHWVQKCLRYNFTIGEDGFDYVAELNKILQTWESE